MDKLVANWLLKPRFLRPRPEPRFAAKRHDLVQVGLDGALVGAMTVLLKNADKTMRGP